MNEEQSSRDTNRRRKFIALSIFGVIVAIGFIIGLSYIQYSKTHITTDDAFVEGSVHIIAPKVSGTTQKVYISGNQRVQAGELLLEIEPPLFLQKVKEAEAALEVEKRRLSEIEAIAEAQRKKIFAAEATLKKTISAKDELAAELSARDAELMAKESLLREAEIDLRRAGNLFKQVVLPRDRYDRAKTEYDTRLSALKVAEELKRKAEVSLRVHENVILQAEAFLKVEKAVLEQIKSSFKTQEGEIKRREAQLEIERLNLSYTKIYSPTDGYVTRKSIEVGNQLKAGQPLMAVVSLDDVYVVANYKETQLEKIRPGQRVKIKVSAYPGKVFWGRVNSIMAGTGAAFSLFPPENATGNYVKVVQRIPIKIVFDEGLTPIHVLRVGMSVVPTVLTE